MRGSCCAAGRYRVAILVRQLIYIAAWLSQGVNCVLLFGHPDQTVSARAWVNRNKGWFPVVRAIDAFFWLVFRQSDHCRKSHEADLQFAWEILRNE
jgi:hypothetical protein